MPGASARGPADNIQNKKPARHQPPSRIRPLGSSHANIANTSPAVPRSSGEMRGDFRSPSAKQGSLLADSRPKGRPSWTRGLDTATPAQPPPAAATTTARSGDASPSARAKQRTGLPPKIAAPPAAEQGAKGRPKLSRSASAGGVAFGRRSQQQSTAKPSAAKTKAVPPTPFEQQASQNDQSQPSQQEPTRDPALKAKLEALESQAQQLAAEKEANANQIKELQSWNSELSEQLLKGDEEIRRLKSENLSLRSELEVSNCSRDVTNKVLLGLTSQTIGITTREAERDLRASQYHEEDQAIAGILKSHTKDLAVMLAEQDQKASQASQDATVQSFMVLLERAMVYGKLAGDVADGNDAGGAMEDSAFMEQESALYNAVAECQKQMAGSMRAELEEQMASLKSSYQAREEAIEKVEAAWELTQREVQGLQDRIKELEGEVDDRDAALVQEEDTKLELAERLRTTESKASELVVDVLEKEMHISTLEARQSELEQTNKKLDAKLYEAGSAESHMRLVVEEELSALQQRLEQRDQFIASLQECQHDLLFNHHDIEARLKVSEAEASWAQELQESLHEEREAVQQELRVAQAEAKQLVGEKEQLTRALADKEKEVQANIALVESLQRKVTELSSERERLSLSLATAESEKESSAQELASVHQQQLKTANDRQLQLEAKLRAAEGERQEEIASMSARLGEAATSLASLRMQVTAAKAQLSRGAELHAKETTELDRQLRVVKEERAADVRELQAEISSLSSRLEDADGGVTWLRGSLVSVKALATKKESELMLERDSKAREAQLLSAQLAKVTTKAAAAAQLSLLLDAALAVASQIALATEAELTENLLVKSELAENLAAELKAERAGKRKAVEALNADLSDLSLKADAVQCRVVSLQEELAFERAQSAECQLQIRTEADDLANCLQAERAKRAESIEEAKELQRSVFLLSTRLEQATAESESTARETKQLLAEASEREAELSAHAACAEQVLHQETEIIAAFAESTRAQVHALASLKQELAATQLALEARQNEAFAAINRAEARCSCLEALKLSLEQQVAQADADLVQRAAECREANVRMELLETERGSLRVSLAETSARVRSMSVEAITAAEALADLEGMLERGKADHACEVDRAHRRESELTKVLAGLREEMVDVKQLAANLKGERDTVRCELTQLQKASAQARAAAAAETESLSERLEAEMGAKRQLACRLSTLAARHEELEHSKTAVDLAYRQQARQLHSLQASQSLLHGDRRNLEDLLHENFLM